MTRNERHREIYKNKEVFLGNERELSWPLSDEILCHWLSQNSAAQAHSQKNARGEGAEFPHLGRPKWSVKRVAVLNLLLQALDGHINFLVFKLFDSNLLRCRFRRTLPCGRKAALPSPTFCSTKYGRNCRLSFAGRAACTFQQYVHNLYLLRNLLVCLIL